MGLRNINNEDLFTRLLKESSVLFWDFINAFREVNGLIRGILSHKQGPSTFHYQKLSK